MTRFSLHYKHREDYDDRIELDINLQVRPKKEDYQKLLDAIKLLDEVRAAYIKPAKLKQEEAKK